MSGPAQPVAKRESESVELATLEQRLNALGSQGWELVAYGLSPLRAWSTRRDPRTIAVFKRRAR